MSCENERGEKLMGISNRIRKIKRNVLYIGWVALSGFVRLFVCVESTTLDIALRWFSFSYSIFCFVLHQLRSFALNTHVTWRSIHSTSCNRNK